MSTKGGNRRYDQLITLLLIGDSGVGKSCLLLRYSNDSFTSSREATIGMEFQTKIIQCGERKVKLNIWENAGQGSYPGPFYHRTKGILIVYDVSDENSFMNVPNWMKQVRQHAAEGAKVVLIGNKCDLDPSERKISTEQGRTLANDYEIQFFETSAKLNVNVDECFLYVTLEILEKIEEDEHSQALHLNDMMNTKKKQASCY